MEQRILRRNDPGCKKADWYNWETQKIDDLKSLLFIQEWIQQTIRENYKDVDGILKCPQGVEEGVWKYEHLRIFCMELNRLTVGLQEECNPACCPQMTATEQWIFLCAAHKNPKECPAIDYTRHTLDSAATLLNSYRYFPSRVRIKESSIAKIGSICRRVYRIFSHAYFHHRKLFDTFEENTYLCRRFTMFVIKYSLMAPEHLIVPILNEPSTVSSPENVVDKDDV
uniref:MOB-like protein phocein n=1 Tax=Panagrolaimus superbus TaxID=310955 RepID=A0A914Y9Y7_9BILA